MPERIEPKMLIDREHDGDALLLDYSEARAVGEAEGLVAVPNEDILGPPLVARGDSDHADGRPFYAVYGFHGRNVARSSPDESVGFIEDEVRRDKRGTRRATGFREPERPLCGLGRACWRSRRRRSCRGRPSTAATIFRRNRFSAAREARGRRRFRRRLAASRASLESMGRKREKPAMADSHPRGLIAGSPIGSYKKSRTPRIPVSTSSRVSSPGGTTISALRTWRCGWRRNIRR